MGVVEPPSPARVAGTARALEERPMPVRTRTPRRRVVALFWTALLALPVAAPAQQAVAGAAPAPQSAPAEKRVSLDVEDVRLVTAIKLLMQSARADYTIDNALRGATVTAHLT